MRRSTIIGALLAGGLALAGCTPAEEPSTAPPAPGTPPKHAPAPAPAGHGQADAHGGAQGEGEHGGESGHTSTDQEFAAQMVAHHEQAVQLADLALQKAQNAQVKTLAAKIKQGQQPEIEQFEAWLAKKAGHASNSAPEDAAGHAEMPGMVTKDKVEALQKASGAEFDRLWVQAMLTHHEGAVQTARAELEEGSDAEIRALAEKIVQAQQSEIEQLKSIKL